MTTASARHILVQTEQECLDLKTRIDGGEDFAEVAKAHSSCPSKAQGGDLGSFGPGMMVKEFDEVVFSAPRRARPYRQLTRCLRVAGAT